MIAYQDMYIYFVRHGQTEFNVSGMFQTAETPLSNEGEMQATKVAERLSKTKIDEIWSSPMKRARQTADLINEYQKVHILEEENLREIKRATSFEGKLQTDPTIAHIADEVLAKEKSDPYYKFEDSDQFVQVIDRCRVLLKKLEKKADGVDEDFSLCIATHGLILSTILLCILLPAEADPAHLLSAKRKIWQENTSISLASFYKNQWKIFTIGDFAHL